VRDREILCFRGINRIILDDIVEEGEDLFYGVLSAAGPVAYLGGSAVESRETQFPIK
jgi:hypothetical protein